MGRYSDEVVRQGEAFEDSQDMGALAVLRTTAEALRALVVLDDGDKPGLWAFAAQFDAGAVALAKADALLSRSGVRPSAPAPSLGFEGHTPGPWHLTEQTNIDTGETPSAGGVAEGDGYVICTVWADGIWRDATETAEANRRLIAAAPAIPSLLSALRPIASAYPDDPGTSDLDDEQPVTITLGDVRRAQAALREVEESR